MDTFNFNLFKYFYYIVIYNGFTNASKYLNISQPSLSFSIKRLEEEDLYKRAVLRYERGERELRANSFEDALSQREWERKFWIELYKKFNLEHIELNSSNNTPEEMTNIMNIQILSKRR